MAEVAPREAGQEESPEGVGGRVQSRNGEIALVRRGVFLLEAGERTV